MPTPTTAEHPPQNTPLTGADLEQLHQVESLASLTQRGVFVTKKPGSTDRMVAFKIHLEPVAEIAAETLNSSSTFELLASSSHTRFMVEGEKNRIHHSLWRQGTIVRSIFMMDYTTWNAAMVPEVMDGKLILRHRSLRDNENLAGDGKIRHGMGWFERGSMNWRCLIRAQDFGCHAVGVIVRSTSSGKFVSGGGDRMGYSLFLVKFNAKSKVPQLFYPPTGNVYNHSGVCAPVVQGCTGYGPEPDGVFSDFENSPGNFDLVTDLSRHILGEVPEQPEPDNENEHPYVRLRLEKGYDLPATSLSLPPLWEMSSFRETFDL